MEADGFQLVRNKKRAHCKPPTLAMLTRLETLSVYDHPTEDMIQRSVQRVIQYKNKLATSKYYQHLMEVSIPAIGDVLGKNSSQKTKIVALGLGHVGANQLGQQQLALLMLLRDQLNASTLVFDPLFDTLDKTVLERLDFRIDDKNRSGVYNMSGDTATLFYLPHCPPALTNNILYANWGLTLSSVVIVANSFRSVKENILGDRKDAWTRALYYIWKVLPHVTEFPMSFKRFSDLDYSRVVFNDVCVHTFQGLEGMKWDEHPKPEYDDTMELMFG